MTTPTTTVRRLPNGHLLVRLVAGSKPYEFVLEDLGNIHHVKGVLLAGSDGNRTTIPVVADLSSDEVTIGRMTMRADLGTVREKVEAAGPPMRAEEVRAELGLPSVAEVWKMVDAGKLIEVGHDQKGRRLIGAAGVLRLKGASMGTHDDITYHEAAEMLGVAHGSIAHYVKSGKLVQTRKGKPGGKSAISPLVSRKSVEEFRNSDAYKKAMDGVARAKKRLATQAANKAKPKPAPKPVESGVVETTPEPIAVVEQHTQRMASVTPLPTQASGIDQIDLQLAVIDGYVMCMDDDNLLGMVGRLRELLGRELP